MLLADGWYQHDQVGSHRQFKHPTKKGRVTVNGKTKRHTSTNEPQQYLETGRVAISPCFQKYKS